MNVIVLQASARKVIMPLQAQIYTRTSRLARGIGWVLLVASLPCPGAGGRVCSEETFVRLGHERIELRRSGENRLFLFGKLDGRKQSMLVDTGWSFTTVSTRQASKLRTQSQSELPSTDPVRAGGKSPASVVMRTLNLGGVVFTNQPARVQDLVFNSRPAPFDVVLGCDFLIKNYAVIDCAKRRLYTRRLEPSEKQRTEFEDCMRQDGFVFVDLKPNNPLALSCPVRLDGELVELLVDTGAVWSCLDASAATRLGLKLQPTPRQITGAGATGRRGFAVAQAKKIELSGREMGQINFAALPLGDWGLSAPGAVLAEVVGILGGPELAAWNAIIDCRAMRLWFKPPTARR